jgi:hypothetical protein
MRTHKRDLPIMNSFMHFVQKKNVRTHDVPKYANTKLSTLNSGRHAIFKSYTHTQHEQL